MKITCSHYHDGQGLCLVDFNHHLLFRTIGSNDDLGNGESPRGRDSTNRITVNDVK
jgi:hypothetical protein